MKKAVPRKQDGGGDRPFLPGAEADALAGKAAAQRVPGLYVLRKRAHCQGSGTSSASTASGVWQDVALVADHRLVLRGKEQFAAQGGHALVGGKGTPKPDGGW